MAVMMPGHDGLTPGPVRHRLTPARRLDGVLLQVNGRPSEVADGTTLPTLLDGLGLRLGSVVVEHNGTALLRSEAEAVVLADGDRLELVRAVAGG